MSFLDDYEPVELRLERFWADYPDGVIETELVSATDGQWVFKASAFKAPGVLKATGYAHEVTGSSSVNKTSAAENCETSAIGRALANAGYAAKGKRPSREEMTKAAPPPPPEKERFDYYAQPLATKDDLSRIGVALKTIADAECRKTTADGIASQFGPAHQMRAADVDAALALIAAASSRPESEREPAPEAEGEPAEGVNGDGSEHADGSSAAAALPLEPV